MKKRLLLSRLVGALFAVLVIAFLWVFLKGISFSYFEVKQTDSSADIFAGLQPGQSALRRHQKQMVWVTYLDQRLRRQLVNLDPYLIDPKLGCDMDLQFCVLQAQTSVDGIYMQFSPQPPSQLPSNMLWAEGGLVDPTTGQLYDILGRAYKLRNAKTASLPVVIQSQ